MRTAIMCAALALTVTAAEAVEKDAASANFFLPYCKTALTDQANHRSFPAGVCVGSIRGVAAMLLILQPLMRQHRDLALCADIPGDVTPEQMIRVVIRYIEANPKDMHELFEGLAMLALVDAWPCKN